MLFNARQSARRRRLLLAALGLIALAAVVLTWQTQNAGPAVPAQIGKQTAIEHAESKVQGTAAQVRQDSPPAERAPAPATTAPSPASHRASAAQLQADQTRLQLEPDLSLLAAELQQRARLGDADAAWTMGKLYEACAEALLAKSQAAELERFMDGLRVMDISEAEVTTLRNQFDDLSRRCDKFAAGPVLAAMSQTWMARARQLGHPGARLQEGLPSAPPDSPARAEYRQRTRLAGLALLRARNAWDLARYADALAQRSPYSTDAYLHAACQLAEDCVVDPSRWSLTSAALWIASGGPSMISLRHLPPRQRQIVNGQAAELMRLWRAGEFEQILRGDPLFPNGGGG